MSRQSRGEELFAQGVKFFLKNNLKSPRFQCQDEVVEIKGF